MAGWEVVETLEYWIGPVRGDDAAWKGVIYPVKLGRFCMYGG